MYKTEAPTILSQFELHFYIFNAKSFNLVLFRGWTDPPPLFFQFNHCSLNSHHIPTHTHTDTVFHLLFFVLHIPEKKTQK